MASPPATWIPGAAPARMPRGRRSRPGSTCRWRRCGGSTRCTAVGPCASTPRRCRRVRSLPSADAAITTRHRRRCGGQGGRLRPDPAGAPGGRGRRRPCRLARHGAGHRRQDGDGPRRRRRRIGARHRRRDRSVDWPVLLRGRAEVRETFHVAGFAETDLDRWFLPAESPRATHVLDMWRSNRDQLVAAGLDPATSTWPDSARRRTATGCGRIGAKARTPAGCSRSSGARDHGGSGYRVVEGVIERAARPIRRA